LRLDAVALVAELAATTGQRLQKQADNMYWLLLITVFCLLNVLWREVKASRPPGTWLLQWGLLPPAPAIERHARVRKRWPDECQPRVEHLRWSSRLVEEGNFSEGNAAGEELARRNHAEGYSGRHCLLALAILPGAATLIPALI